MNRLEKNGLTVLGASVFALSCSVSALNFNTTDATNIVADGIVADGEWNQADFEADLPNSNDGAMYAMRLLEEYIIDNGNDDTRDDIKYEGCFQFLLHNIELITTQDDADYNVFDIFPAGEPNNRILTIWVFNEIDSPVDTDSKWMSASGLTERTGLTKLDDRGFLVYNYDEGDYRHWLPEDTAPADGGYDWSYYWGVHALGGFNNSAFEEELPLAIDNNNALYEVIYRPENPEDCSGAIRRNAKDPDKSGPFNPPRKYWDDVLSVTLSSVTANASDGKVTLDWVTGTEKNNAKFVVFRGELLPEAAECSANIDDYKAGTIEELSQVDSKGTEVSGATYTITDSDVVSGNSYCYALEDVDYDGNSTFHLDKIVSATP